MHRYGDCEPDELILESQKVISKLLAVNVAEELELKNAIGGSRIREGIRARYDLEREKIKQKHPILTSNTDSADAQSLLMEDYGIAQKRMELEMDAEPKKPYSYKEDLKTLSKTYTSKSVNYLVEELKHLENPHTWDSDPIRCFIWPLFSKRKKKKDIVRKKFQDLHLKLRQAKETFTKKEEEIDALRSRLHNTKS